MIRESYSMKSALDQEMKFDSAGKRYSVTLIVRFFNLLTGLLNATIVPRALGPTNFGDYHFLFNIMTSFSGFLNLGSSNAFYTYCSKNIKSGKAFEIYYSWTLLQLIIILLFILISTVLGYSNSIFLNQKTSYIFIIAGLVWVTSLSKSLINFGESKAETVYVQKKNMAVQFIKSIALVSLFVVGLLTLNSFIIVNYFSTLMISLWIIIFLIIPKRRIYLSSPDSKEVREIISYFVFFCTPLIAIEILGLAVNFFNRWFLQAIFGSTDQAYFSLAYSWCMVTLLFSASLEMISWREIAFSFARNDIQRIRHIYSKSFSLNIFLTSFFAWFLAFNAEKILRLFAGEKYIGATLVLVVMAFHPIHVALGKINFSYFYATEQVRLLRNLLIIGAILSLAATYVFLAPKTYVIPGLEMGALGLALKSLIVPAIFNNVQLYFVLKKMNQSFKRFLGMQAKIIFVLAVLAYFSMISTDALSLLPLFHIFFMFGIYLLLTVGLVYLRPQIIGLTVAEREEYKRKSLTILRFYF